LVGTWGGREINEEDDEWVPPDGGWDKMEI
jgi:hypothetical protein